MAPTGRVVLELRLPGEALSARRAREAVGERYAAHARSGDLLLCLSEVVTNAVLHARSAVHLVVREAGGRVRCEVADDDPTLPVARDPGPTTPTGRGLRLVEALSSDWGVDRRRDGKTVWFEVDGA